MKRKPNISVCPNCWTPVDHLIIFDGDKVRKITCPKCKKVIEKVEVLNI